MPPSSNSENSEDNPQQEECRCPKNRANYDITSFIPLRVSRWGNGDQSLQKPVVEIALRDRKVRVLVGNDKMTEMP